MIETQETSLSSPGKKYLMAISGLILVLFILGHMLGNLNFFGGPEAINAYAWELRHLPGGMSTLWFVRIVLMLAVLVHIWTAILVTADNRRARPENYAVKDSLVATYAARTMPVTGVLLLAFIILHILQFTMHVIPADLDQIIGKSAIEVNDHTVMTFDVYAMIVNGFPNWLYSIIYIVAVAILGLHLSHGVASMFQSMGWRNEAWRKRLFGFARLFGLVIFLGFASIPVSVWVFGVGKDYLKDTEQKWSEQGAAIHQQVEKAPAK